MKNNFELLIFDWDGTLMDSEAHIVDCLRVAMQAVEGDLFSRQSLRQVIGLGLPEAIARLIPEASKEKQLVAIEAFRAEFLAAERSPSRVFTGARELLSSLRQQGYWLAVATGKSRRGLEKDLAETGLDDFFSITRCADEAFSKPNPQMLYEILTDMDTSADKALMIGDTEFDLEMAVNALMPSVGVSYGVHSVERLQRHQPLEIVDSLPELGSWLQR